MKAEFILGRVILFLGGYLAHVDEWEKFNDKWSTFILEYSLQEVHAKPLFSKYKGNPVGIYRHFTNTEVDQIIEAASGIICSLQGMIVGAAINCDDFFSFTPDERRFLT